MFEAGRKDNSPLVRWPAGYARLQGNRTRWEWATTPQEHCGGRRVPFPQGKLLGGGSSVNSMVYIRGNRRDYDSWATQGNDLWSYDQVLPYFRKSEDNERFCDAFHATGGELGVSDQRAPSELTRLFVRAAQEVGIVHNPDFNGARQSGVGFFQVTQRKARRCSAAHAFVYPIMDRPNFSVDTEVRVTRVLVEKGRAVGVEYLRRGSRTPERLLARREVIVSSGSINSAKLLLLSGIGPADELEAHGIAAVHHLPGVGKNLQDHLDAFSCITLKQPISYTAQDKGLPAIRHGVEFLLFGTGAITSNVCEGGLFANTRGSEDWPDIQMHFIPAALPTHQPVKGHAVTLTAAYMRPQSRGEVTLASADPFDEPLIDPKFLSHPDDLQHNIDGVKLAREVLAAPAFSKVIREEAFPGKHVRTDAEIGEYVRQNAKTDFHPVGTCRMGEDEMAVVSQDLSVRGLEGLRVIDASVMPTIVTGNTNGPSIMIGERGADFILGRSLPRAAPAAPGLVAV